MESSNSQFTSMQAQQRMRPVDDVANVASLALPLQSQDTEVNDPGSALSP